MIAWPNDSKSSAAITNDARPADDVVAEVLRQPARRIGVLGIPRHRPLAQDHQAVDGDALGHRLVARERTSRPELLVPSPETSMVRRADWNGARSNCAIEKSMPPLIEVRSANERGASTSWSPNWRAARGPSITVQSITTFCAPTPDHSTKLERDLAVRAGADGVEHPRVGDRGGVALALQLELLMVDAARDVGGEHQQQIDRLRARAAPAERAPARAGE